MTLLLDLDLHILRTYPHQNEICRSVLSEVRAQVGQDRQTHAHTNTNTQTDMTERITTSIRGW